MSTLRARCHLLLLFFLASSTAKASVLEDTCKSVAAAGQPGIGYDYCIEFFEASPRSATANKRGLAVIALRITGATAKNTAHRIDSLRASEKDKKRLACLADCAEVYAAAVGQLKAAEKGIVSGSDVEMKDALTNLSAALGAPEICEDGFREENQSSPLVAEDTEFDKEASISLAVTHALSPSRK